MQIAKLSVRITLGAALAALGASSCAPSLAAPPHLVASWPQAGARLSVARHTLELTFNHPLLADATSAAVWSDDGGSIATDTTLDAVDSRRLRVRLIDPAAGSYQLHWHAVAADTHLAMDGDQPFTLQSESGTPPRVDVSPASADVDKRLELVGKGFAARSPLQLTIGDGGQALAETETDAQGAFNVEARVPAGVPFGMQAVTAIDGEGRTAMAALDVRWGGWPPAVATNTGQPGQQHGQVSFTLDVRNVSDYVLEHVRVVMQDPENGTLVTADPGAQRENGTLVWIVPVMDRGPFGPFHATYLADQPVVSHAWLEYRHRHARGCSGVDCLPAFMSVSTADSQPTSPA